MLSPIAPPSLVSAPARCIWTWLMYTYSFLLLLLLLAWTLIIRVSCVVLVQNKPRGISGEANYKGLWKRRKERTFLDGHRTIDQPTDRPNVYTYKGAWRGIIIIFDCTSLFLSLGCCLLLCMRMQVPSSSSLSIIGLELYDWNCRIISPVPKLKKKKKKSSSSFIIILPLLTGPRDFILRNPSKRPDRQTTRLRNDKWGFVATGYVTKVSLKAFSCVPFFSQIPGKRYFFKRFSFYRRFERSRHR